jgi:hypothetical protein
VRDAASADDQAAPAVHAYEKGIPNHHP